MQLELGEQDPVQIEALFDELDELTGSGFAGLKQDIDAHLAARCGIAREQLQPWHYQDRFFQEAPVIYPVDLDAYYKDKDLVKIAKTFYAGIGMPVDDVIARSDLFEKPGKYQHAFSSDIDRAGGNDDLGLVGEDELVPLPPPDPDEPAVENERPDVGTSLDDVERREQIGPSPCRCLGSTGGRPGNGVPGTRRIRAFARSDDWWRLRRLADPESRRAGGGPMQRVLLETGGEPAGYALYRMHPATEGGAAE